MISKVKAESWQKTCSSLSPETCPSKVFFLLWSISGSSSSPSTGLPNFPNFHTSIDVQIIFLYIYNHTFPLKSQNLSAVPNISKRKKSGLPTAISFTPVSAITFHHSRTFLCFFPTFELNFLWPPIKPLTCF